MRKIFARLGAALWWLIIVAALAIVIVPRFLDRIYYDGSVSAHFDGAHFFNPDGDDAIRPPMRGSRAGFLWRLMTGAGRQPWPDSVSVTPLNARALPPLANGDMRATWVGHATVLIETPGFAMLTDPIWSDFASPVPGAGPRRVAAPGIDRASLPKIDLIVVSHNHYDHMDIATLRWLWQRDKPVILTSLGNDAILRANGIGEGAPQRIVALDWGGDYTSPPCAADQSAALTCAAWTAHVTRNHHWGSRTGVDRNRALWSSFVVDTPSGRLFFAGDTGFGDGQWPAEARAIPGPPIRFAMIPIGAFRFQPGQMNIGQHIGPSQAIKVWNRLGAPFAMPIHWGTFQLSSEAYGTPPAMLHLLMRCAGGPSERFQAAAIGRPIMVPPVAMGASIAESEVDRCLSTPAVTALE